MVREIEQNRPQGGGRNRVTLVFDGRPGPAAPIQSSAVQVIFSMDRSADDRIREMVKNAANARQVVVVTDDRALQYAVRAGGARVWSVAEFLARLRGGKAPSPSKGKTLTQRQIEQINRELEERWLKPESDSD